MSQKVKQKLSLSFLFLLPVEAGYQFTTGECTTLSVQLLSYRSFMFPRFLVQACTTSQAIHKLQ